MNAQNEITVLTSSNDGSEIVHKFETIEKARSWIERFDATFTQRYVIKVYSDKCVYSKQSR